MLEADTLRQRGELAGNRTQESLLQEMTGLIERHTRRDGVYPTAIGPLALYRVSTPTGAIPTVYEPSLCIIAQGQKRLLLGDESYCYDSAQYLLVSVDLPIIGQITEATPANPYLSICLNLDASLMAEMMVASDRTATVRGNPGRALTVSHTGTELLESVVRLLRLLERPGDIRVLAPLVQREIIYHLLIGEQGDRLCQIATGNSQAQRIARAIQWLKSNYNQPFHIEEVARAAYMSPSGLHHHFKTVTAMSPLQYQKHLRLHEARRLMLNEGVDATSAGYQVGYESPSQFSREYRRLFGAPPVRDISHLRSIPAAEFV